MPLEPRASWFSPKNVEAQQLSGYLGVKQCFGAGCESEFEQTDGVITTNTICLNIWTYDAYESYAHKYKSSYLEEPISEALPPREEVVHDVLNYDHDGNCITNNLLGLDDGNQQEFGIRDCADKLSIPEGVPDPINVETNITIDVAANVKVEVTTNMECKPILNESVEEPIHFLAIAKNVPAEEINKFD
ncbi:hypothetical protein Gotri_007606 [Gossypium trilobum]|uniref:Uncharacterized protein n=1 Tax=Gossypium trilobum TaxID=34281 RepID=A0A7J9EGN4_9ROSI|nr:hypothetical protein [Gossypium trilobum]